MKIYKITLLISRKIGKMIRLMNDCGLYTFALIF